MNSNTLTPAERLAASFVEKSRRFQEMITMTHPLPNAPIQPASMAFPLQSMLPTQITNCLFCHLQFSTQDELTRHLQLEHPTLLSNLSSQQLQHQSNSRRTNFNCNLCGNVCDTQEQLLTHFSGQKHRRKAQWHAAFCAESQQFESHFITEDSPGFWNCNACGIPLLGENSVLQHIRSGKHIRQRDAFAVQNTSRKSSTNPSQSLKSQPNDQIQTDSISIDNASRSNNTQQTPSSLRAPTGIAKTKNAAQVASTKKSKTGVILPSYDCVTCGVSCNSMESLNAHLASIRHKKKIRQIESPNVQPPNATQKNASDVNIMCDICNVAICGKENFEIHVRGKTHQKRAKANGFQTLDPKKKSITDDIQMNKDIVERKGGKKGNQSKESHDNRHPQYSIPALTEPPTITDMSCGTSAINNSFQMPLSGLSPITPMTNYSNPPQGFPNMMPLSSMQPGSMIPPFPPTSLMPQPGSSSQLSLNQPVSQLNMMGQTGLPLGSMTQPISNLATFNSMEPSKERQLFPPLLPNSGALQYPQTIQPPTTQNLFLQQPAVSHIPAVSSSSVPMQTSATRTLTDEQQKNIMQLLQKVAEQTKKLSHNGSN